METSPRKLWRGELESCLVSISDRELAQRARTNFFRDGALLFESIEMVETLGLTRRDAAGLVAQGTLSRGEAEILSELSDIFVSFFRKFNEADNIDEWVAQPEYEPVYSLAQRALDLMRQNDRLTG